MITNELPGRSSWVGAAVHSSLKHQHVISTSVCAGANKDALIPGDDNGEHCVLYASSPAGRALWIVPTGLLRKETAHLKSLKDL